MTQFAMPEIARQFRAARPAIELEIAYGSSGNFFAQISQRAPFDVFLSADVEYPRKLASAGVATGTPVFTYAVGRLVVWVPAASPLDPATALREPSLKHLAIANPQHAPYGRAAQAALRTLGLYPGLEPKLVLGENIAQTLQFVESGAADAGIVAMSLAQAPPMRARGRYWEIPLDAYPRMEPTKSATSTLHLHWWGRRGTLWVRLPTPLAGILFSTSQPLMSQPLMSPSSKPLNPSAPHGSPGP